MIGSAIGIELCDGALKAVKVRKLGRRLSVTWADYRPYARAEHGAIQVEAGLEMRAAATLRSFLAESRPGPFDRVYVGFPSIATFNRLIHVPDVGAEHVTELARFEAHRSLRGPADDYELRWRVLPPPGHGRETPCQLFAIRKRLRDAFIADLTDCGLEFDSLILSAEALALFVRHDRPRSGDRIVVSIGLRATEVVYLRDEGFCFRTLPLGIVALESIGGAGHEKRAEAARLLVRRIAAEIGKGIAFFFGKHGGFEPAAVSLFGEGAQNPEVCDEFRRLYPTQVEAIGELNRIRLDKSLTGPGGSPVAGSVPWMGSALGLAIAAARAESPVTEVIPPNRAREASRRLPGLAAAALFVAAGATLVGWLDDRELARVQRLQVTPTADELHARESLAERTTADLERLERAEHAVTDFVSGHSARGPFLAKVLSAFAPENHEFGPSALRLIDCSLAQDGRDSRVTGRVRIAWNDDQAETVLKKRLALVAGVRDPKVEEIPEQRDELAQTKVLKFEAVLPGGPEGRS